MKWIAGLAVFFAIVVGWRYDAQATRIAGLEARADSINAELLLADSTLGLVRAERSDIEARLLQSDSSVIALVERLTAANARVTQFVRADVVTRGQIASLADSVQALLNTDEPSLSAQGLFDDGRLAASWRFDWPPGLLELPDYTVTTAIELLTVEFGDGRIAVRAQSPDPRVTVEFDEVLFDPPPPEVVYRTNKRRLMEALVVGILGGLLLR